MAGKMKKSDVKYQVKVAQFDQNRAKEIAGRAIPQGAKSLVDAAAKRLKKGEVKDPYVKIGLIKADLYMRIKDGDTDLDEFMLVKDWVDPAGTVAPVRDASYQKKLKDFVDDRRDSLTLIETKTREIKARYTRIESNLERARGNASEAERGSFGYRDVGAEASEKFSDSQRLFGELEKIFDDEIHPLFDRHRTLTKPAGVDDSDVSDWGKDWYLAKMRPKYASAKEYVELAKTAVAETRVAANRAIKFSGQNVNKLDAYRQLAVELLEILRSETDRAQKLWAMSPPDNVAAGIISDAKQMKEATDPELKIRHFNNASGRLIGLNNGHKRLGKHTAKITEIANRIKEIPREFQADTEIRQSLGALATQVSNHQAYVKTIDGHLKDAVKAFSVAKKLAA